MRKVNCISKFKGKNGRVYMYRLMDANAEMEDIHPYYLKQEIKKGETYVINLTLEDIIAEATNAKPLDEEEEEEEEEATYDIKPTIKAKSSEKDYILLTRDIVESINSPKDLKFESNQDLKTIEQKALLLGYTIEKINKNLLSMTTNKEIILVSDKQIRLTNTEITKYVNQFDSSTGLFESTEFKSIDFHNTDTSNVTDMGFMFKKCEAQSLDLSSFETSNVKRMTFMFEKCAAQSLDLSSFETSKVTDMFDMFEECKANSINLSSFNTSNVTCMHGMFDKCEAKSLDLSSFNTSNVTDMGWMFAECKANSIDLSSFNTSKVKDMRCMFAYAKAKLLDLSSFNGKSANKEDMFRGRENKLQVYTFMGFKYEYSFKKERFVLKDRKKVIDELKISNNIYGL